MTAYDALLARRTAALGVALAMLVYLAMLGTDDAASTHAGRLGRLAALATLAGGGAAFLALSQARARGEMRALAATGGAPGRAALGAVVGGAFVGFLGAALALTPWVDLGPLFPRALPTDGGWMPADGAWLDRAHAVRVAADGVLSRVGAPGAVDTVASSPPLGATVLALVLASIAFPLWAAASEPIVRRASVCFAVASAAVFVFHLVAARQINPMTLVLPPVLLLLDALAPHRGRSWS